jgi:hypothetical protein
MWKTHFVTSLSLMILFNSSATAGETNTAGQPTFLPVHSPSLDSAIHTLFTDQRVISVIRVVGITDTSYPSVLIHPPALVPLRKPIAEDVPCEYSNSRNSWPCIP